MLKESIMKNKIRYGIIGFGLFAERSIAPAIQASVNSELIAIQKRSIDEARKKADSLGIPYAFDSAENLVSHPDIDAVFVVSANCMHAPETIIAAKAGKHVLVEKPMAINAAEAKAMIKTCRKNKVKLMVAHMIRFSPVTQRIKELIKNDAIGKVTAVKSEFIYDGKVSHRGWLLDRKVAGGGPVFDIGVHCLDTIRFLLEDEVISVKSQLQPLPTKDKTESTAFISLKLSKGTVAGILCSYDSAIRRSYIELIGEKGLVSAENFSWNNTTIRLNVSLTSNGKVMETREEIITVPNLYEKEVTAFSDCIINDTLPPIPGEEGLKNQKVLDQIMRG